MPYRSFPIVLGVFGLLAVLGLVLFRADPERHSQSGPRWKQRLVAAGLVLMGLLGFGPACKRAPTKPNGPTPQPPPGGDPRAGMPAGGMAHGGQKDADEQPAYALTAEWKAYFRARAEAEEIAAGKRGSYPFDRAGKKRLLAALAKGATDLDVLASKGLLDSGEAGLLKFELKRLDRRVRGFRTNDMRRATCYEPVARPLAARESMARLKQRLPFIKQLATAKTLHPKVLQRLIKKVEADLVVLEAPKTLGQLPAREKKQAKNLAAAIRHKLGKLKTRLATPPAPSGATGGAFQGDARWQKVELAWKTITPLATSGRSTSAQRTQADVELKAARAAIAELTKVGKLRAEEAALLNAEGDRLRNLMYRNPPTDRMVKCYKRKHIVPARLSLGRLNKRLPFLERLAASGKLRPAVVSRILPAVRRDLQTLTSPQERKLLRPEEQARADATARKIKMALGRIDKRNAR